MQSSEIENKDKIGKREQKILEYQQTRDPKALNQVINDYSPLLYSLAGKYRSYGFEDILQTAYVGLINAINRYQYKKGAKFITYATFLIEGEIKHYLRDQVLIKEPRWAKSLNADIKNFIIEFQAQSQKLPSISEIAEGLNVTEEGVLEVLKIKNCLQLESLDTNDTNTHGETFKSEKIKSLKFESFHLPLEDKIVLSEAMDSLSELQKKAIYYFFYKDLSQTEMAERLGLTQRKISYLINNALSKLKQVLGKELW